MHMGLHINHVLLCGYSCVGVSITGRAAKCVRTVLDSSIEEESVAQVSSQTGEMYVIVLVCVGDVCVVCVCVYLHLLWACMYVLVGLFMCSICSNQRQ